MATAGRSDESSTIERRRNDGNRRSDYWKKVVSHYERRNASLERKQAALVERVRFMECALPSLLMGAVVGAKRVPEMSNDEMSSRSRLNPVRTNVRCSPNYGPCEMVPNGPRATPPNGQSVIHDSRHCRTKLNREI